VGLCRASDQSLDANSVHRVSRRAASMLERVEVGRRRADAAPSDSEPV
jgi:hypothetical protein